MRVVLIVAQSLDGFITRHDAPGADWASAADQAWFRRSLTQFDAQVMARQTYDTVRESILPRRTTGPFRVIMTRDPAKHAADHLQGRLEFTDQNPAGIVRRLTAQGCTACALLGGATAHDTFLAAGLVDELWVTVEPRLFGAGTPIVKAPQDRTLQLIAHERLPDSDSLVLKYRVRA